MSWSVHLARRQPARTAAVALIALAGGLLGYALFSNPWMVPFGVLVILLGTADFMLPVKFKVDAKGATSRCGLSVTSIEWEKVQRVVPGPDGVKLSPVEAGSRLAPFRGVFLRADGNLQEIEACVTYWREQHASNVGSTADGRGQGEAGGEDR